MSLNRIQKLLFSEYCDFEDMVLIESPFAETSRTGVGLRQVQIALTPTKLILATENLDNVNHYSVFFYPERIDPEIETMELISIFPVELVSLSVWQKRRRNVLKARLHDGNPKTYPRTYYFELGGQEKKKMLWNLWREKVRFLSPDTRCGSATEVSVASSASTTSIFLAHTKAIGDKVWRYYDGYQPTDDTVGKATNKFLAICKNIENKNPTDSIELETIYRNPRCEYSQSSGSPLPLTPRMPIANTIRVNRFGEGVDEHCSNGLFLPTDSYVKLQDVGTFRTKYRFKNFDEFCEQAAGLWQQGKGPRPTRTYALTPCPDLNHCVGIFGTDRAGRFSIQMKRSRSQANVMEERLHVLEAEDLQRQRKTVVGSQSADLIGSRTFSHQLTPDDPILYFWTTDYWYKPDKVNRTLAHCRARKPEEIQKTRKRMFFGRKRTKICADFEEKPLSKIRAAMKMHLPISAWDLKSDALSSQLTIMDAALFLKIPVQELRMLKRQGSARNCKNLMTWLIFSHRVACLTASQILLTADRKPRARLVARFIVASEQCHRLGNHQSTHSLLQGLQSPAVYRLYATWSQVRRYHSTAYGIFKNLSLQYQIAILPDLTKPPYLCSAKFYLDTLLGRLLPQVNDSTTADVGFSTWNGPKPLKALNVDTATSSSLPKIMQQILSVFNIAPGDGSTSSLDSSSPTFLGEGDQLPSPITNHPSCPGLQEAEGVLRASQQAARKYDLCPHRDAQEFLQKMPYHEPHINFQLSLRIEPPS